MVAASLETPAHSWTEERVARAAQLYLIEGFTASAKWLGRWVASAGAR